MDGGSVSIMQQRERVATTGAPAAIGPYSQAIISDGLVFASGQVALEPETGQLVVGDVQVQTRRALHNLSAVLEAAGTSLNQVVKTTVFLTSMENFTPMNEVYAEFFPGDPPARSTVAVAALPKGALVEIEVIAIKIPGGS
jgi:2-iminobutanoate/2-iminopropanoate deaminase